MFGVNEMLPAADNKLETLHDTDNLCFTKWLNVIEVWSNDSVKQWQCEAETLVMELKNCFIFS